LTGLIGKAENQEAAIKRLKEAEASALNNLTEAEKLESIAANDQKAVEKSLAETQERLERIRADFTEQRLAVSARLEPLGIEEIPDADVAPLLASLRARLNAWQAQVEKKAAIEKQIADLDSEVKRLDAIIETQSVALAEKSECLEKLKKNLVSGNDERKALYGDKNPDEEECRLNQAVLDAESAEKQARDRHHEARQKWNATRSRVEDLTKRINQLAPELGRMEAEFCAALASVGFSREEEFLEARLSLEQREELVAKARKLEEWQTDLKARQKDRETRLVAEMSQKLTDKSLDELEAQFKESEGSLKELRDSLAGLKHQLSENTAAKERIKEKQAAIEGQKKECRRWENLHELIGSSDGNKYRIFAQGLTFEMMIGHANRQLQKMTDRYLLVRDETQPLELNVIDNYQAGEIRSTKNLSGGESFIVSLSLALGLSHMASRNVRVDSLFLDEGFGTLDEETLDTALETLAGLQRDGKLIGVISHVAVLKERITTQVEVMPTHGGRSALRGPGCCQRLDS
jgi:exonuclease SbcC